MVSSLLSARRAGPSWYVLASPSPSRAPPVAHSSNTRRGCRRACPRRCACIPVSARRAGGFEPSVSFLQSDPAIMAPKGQIVPPTAPCGRVDGTFDPVPARSARGTLVPWHMTASLSVGAVCSAAARTASSVGSAGGSPTGSISNPCSSGSPPSPARWSRVVLYCRIPDRVGGRPEQHRAQTGSSTRRDRYTTGGRWSVVADDLTARPRATGASGPHAPIDRRRFLRTVGLGIGTLAVVGAAGVTWSTVSGGVFATGTGPAYAAWDQVLPTTGNPLGLVRAAVLAANAHNAQPWHFAVTPHRIDVFADTTRNLGTMDPLRREMHLSLGCASRTSCSRARRTASPPPSPCCPTRPTPAMSRASTSSRPQRSRRHHRCSRPSRTGTPTAPPTTPPVRSTRPGSPPCARSSTCPAPTSSGSPAPRR